MKPSAIGNLASYRPRTIGPGRPSKRQPQVIVPFLKLLSAGESRRRAAKFINVSPKTIQRWLREDKKFRTSVQNAEHAGKPHFPHLRWLNHPFRGRRPPSPQNQRRPPF
ncbi:MAG: helix-turn-helix domain-containing protein [Prosthecobacter sp.]|uniref:helix-turn-helix domain-containing protein n=1 Tax=Prosthecobacter sp. TaxID=1965333 RepID=UPI0025F29C40|nr:helix-turn-helix domain-containing protein [Prosthecobacter sp.]MCF7786796.1 helix-turn-helix domain-containing protein [Prosthecobacter sp.]